MSVVASLINADTSFFEITSSKINDRIISEDIISFSYIEELGMYNSGTLQIYDPEHYYSKVLRFGAPLEISFGYTRNDSTGIARTKKDNPNQLFGASKRSKIQAYVQNPKGTAGADGRVIFNCNFYGTECIKGERIFKVHEGLTKKKLVENLITEMGITSYTIRFTQENDRIDNGVQMPQNTTNYKLLLKLAISWRAIFRVSTDAKGQRTAIFLSPNYLNLTDIPGKMSGASTGNSVLLDYREGEKNVLEYTWENHMGKSGTGDNVRFVRNADGSYTQVRYVTEGDTIKAYKLDTEKIKKKLEEQGDFTKRAEKMKEWMNVEDFEEVKWAFTEIEQSTAPQGLGYSMAVKMIGNPLMSPPVKIKFGKGFPVFYNPVSEEAHVVDYICSKVSHAIDRTGYFMNLDISDAFTTFGGTLQ